MAHLRSAMADQRAERNEGVLSHVLGTRARLRAASQARNLSLRATNDSSIETLRGAAVLLLVAYHSVEGADVVVVEELRKDVLRYFTFSTENIRMPLFTIISGYLYGQRPLDGPMLPFLKGKVRRLMGPFLTVSALSFALRIFVRGNESGLEIGDWWRIYFYRFEQFWYLPSLLLIFLLVVVLERQGLLATPVRVFAATATAVALRPVLSIELFNLDGFIYLLPYFFLGCAVARFSFRPRRERLVALVAIASAGLVFQQIVWFSEIDVDVGRDSLLGTGIGMAVGAAALVLRRPVVWLASLGRFSFPIYLFHIFGIAVAVRVASVASISSELATVALKIAFGVAVSLLAAQVLSRNRWSATLVLGTRWHK
jgi:glucan biosynthesis protein C